MKVFYSSVCLVYHDREEECSSWSFNTIDDTSNITNKHFYCTNTQYLKVIYYPLFFGMHF